jgi:hypothetical protein
MDLTCVLHEFCCPYKHKCIDCGRKSLRKETVNAEDDLENLVNGNLDSCVNFFQIFCTYDIFYFLLLILSNYFE